jgi:DNA adenine methylase
MASAIKKTKRNQKPKTTLSSNPKTEVLKKRVVNDTKKLADNKKAAVAKNSVKKINAPFGYFGSKNKIALQLCKGLPPHNCWVEAFCGSAALTLAKPPVDIEVINDIDSDIVNLFQQLRTNTKKLCEQIALTPYASKELETARTNVEGLSDLERARRFLVQAMMAINGVFGEERGGFSHSDSYTRNNKEARVSRWYNLPDRLHDVVERLRSVRVENKDALKLLSSYLNRPATLVYLDPPYYGDRTNGYRKDEPTKQFHTQLLRLANKAKCMIFISGYQNDLYDSLLTSKKGWQKKTIETITRDPSGNTHKRTEVVWMNIYFTKALVSKVVPITLTKQEKKQKKVNPERNSKKTNRS